MIARKFARLIWLLLCQQCLWFFFGQCSTRVPSDRGGGGGGVGGGGEGISRMKLFIYRRGEWSTAIILSWWHPLELFLVRSALFFSFMKKKDPYLQTSIDHKNIDSWRETKKKKNSPLRKMSCHVKRYLPYLNYTLSPLHSEPFPYVFRAFQMNPYADLTTPTSPFIDITC